MTARYATLRSGRHRLTKQNRDEAEEQARAVQRSVRRQQGALLLLLNEFIRRISSGVNTAFAVRVSQGDADAAMTALQVAAARQFLIDEATPVFAAAFKTAGDAAARVSFFDLGFDVKVEDVLRVANQRTGTMITRITPETTKAIRGSIARSIERGDNARTAAVALRQHVGLNNPQSVALDRLRDRLKTAGVGREKIDRAVAKKAQQFLRNRTEMIARTEMLWSANAAQHEYWLRVMNAGLISTDTRRIWVVTPDDRLCAQCAPLDGAIVGFFESFVSTDLGLPGETLRERPNGDVIRDFPPLHPMCRCTVALDR